MELDVVNWARQSGGANGAKRPAHLETQTSAAAGSHRSPNKNKCQNKNKCRS
jgi:hypothetical protein